MVVRDGMCSSATSRLCGLVLLAGAVLVAGLAPDALGHGIPEADRQAIVEGGNLRYLLLGAEHMVTGYDHLLFLLGIVFFLHRFGEIVKFITAFTLGHSITLLFATLLGITANYFLVDAVIAISVIYKGFENMGGFRRYIEVEPPNLLFMVFAFGLIHGFGLSTRLQQLPLPEEGLVWRILSFNLGVELGQIAALVVILAVLAGWRHRHSWAIFSRVVNGGLIVAGGLLFLTQMHGYLHTIYPDDFGFSADLHEHAHLEMAARIVPIDGFEAEAIAEFVLDDLAAEGILASGWAEAEAGEARRTTYRGRESWVVEFESPAVSDGSRRLYLYMTIDGNYLAVDEE